MLRPDGGTLHGVLLSSRPNLLMRAPDMLNLPDSWDDEAEVKGSGDPSVKEEEGRNSVNSCFAEVVIEDELPGLSSTVSLPGAHLGDVDGVLVFNVEEEQLWINIRGEEFNPGQVDKCIE